jgi:hypothetical protein
MARSEVDSYCMTDGLSGRIARPRIDEHSGGAPGMAFMAAAGITLMKLAQRIREEFEDFPGLRLTVGEGARFWGLDEQVLGYLSSIRFLVRQPDQRYVQADSPC